MRLLEISSHLNHSLCREIDLNGILVLMCCRYLNELESGSRDVSSLSINRVKFKGIQRCFQTIGFKQQVVSTIHTHLSVCCRSV